MQFSFNKIHHLPSRSWVSLSNILVDPRMAWRGSLARQGVDSACKPSVFVMHLWYVLSIYLLYCYTYRRRSCFLDQPRLNFLIFLIYFTVANKKKKKTKLCHWRCQLNGFTFQGDFRIAIVFQHFSIYFLFVSVIIFHSLVSV